MMSAKNILVCGVGIVCGLLLFYFLLKDEKLALGTVSNQTVSSRVWMEYAQDIVRANPVPPPRSARLYAYVSTAYYETLVKTDSEAEASEVVRLIINKIVPSETEATDQKFKEITTAANQQLSIEAKAVEQKLLERMNSDGASEKWDNVQPVGEEYWVGQNPFEPNAKNWKRWIVDGVEFPLPPPPLHGGKEHQAALIAVKEAAMSRTPEQGVAVNFWGGVPGTEAPAGIWQNVLYTEVKDQSISDEKYAFAQMVLAQAVADSFIECWSVKYTFWTKRPDMDDSTITPYLEMENPNFPSYVSGHATISKTAADVLSVLFPEKNDLWQANAAEARDSRLWAGIHFPYDNEVGFLLGGAVAEAVIRKLSLQAL